MGSLSNLYISQSYQSLIHLGTNEAATSTPTELEDGLGNGLGVFVSTDGNVTITGDIYAANLTGSANDTSSFVTTSSFNAYTQSNDSKVNSLINATSSYAISSSVKIVTDGLQTQINGLASTSSVNSISTSVGLLQTFSSSQYKADSSSFDSRINSIQPTGYVTTSSFNAYTQSVNSQLSALEAATSSYATSQITASSLVTASVSQSTITFTKGDGSQFNIVVADISGSTFDTGSLVTTASFNAYTASQDFKNSTFATTSSLNSLSASIYSTDGTQSSLINGKLDTSSFTTFSTSVDSRLDLLELSGSGFATTASVNALSASIYQTDATQSTQITNNSSSFATSISESNFNITNNSASVAVTINNLSSSIYQTDSTQSNNLTTLSSSVFTQFSASAASVLNLSSSVTTTITNLSSSIFQTDATQSNNISELSASNAFDHSRFATTGSNTFNGNQTINGDITASNISVGTLTATTIHTIIESSSVIFSSGSNIFGDEATDTQTLNGQVNIVNSLTASGLIYPAVDGTAGQIITTNGAGKLSFIDISATNITTITEAVRYGENITIGDPLYVSGSNGNRPIVFKADAANPAKMPVIYIASSTGTTNTNTTAIALGLITGVTTTGYPDGTLVYVGEGGGWSANRPSGSNSIVQPLGIVTKEGSGGSGRGLVLNPGPVLLPNIQTGYVWVGDGTNQPVAVATSSFIEDLGGYVTTSSFNAFTQSISSSVDSVSSSVGLLETEVNNLTAQTSSYAISSSVKAVTDGLQNEINTLSTTASVNALSESIFQTDSTQSNNISSNSSSIGLLQTFSGSQYKSDSSSFDSRIDNLEFASGTFVTTASFNDFSTSVDTRLDTLEFKDTTFATTASNNFVGNQNINGIVNVTGSIIATSNSSSFSRLVLTQPSNTIRWGSGPSNVTYLDNGSTATDGRLRIYTGNNLNNGELQFGFSNPVIIGSNGAGIFAAPSTTISGALTASGDISSSTINGIGNVTLFSASVDSRINSIVAGTNFLTTASFNAYTASQDFKNTTFATTSSLNSLSASIFQTDATQSNAITNNSASAATALNTLSASVYQTDATQSNQISALSSSNAFAHSTFATTGSNTFNGNQTINGAISASGNISASSLYVTNATIVNLTTIFETSSVIYSSGSNQLGDELTDVQILSGSVKVVGDLTINGVSVSTQSFVDLGPLNQFTASQYVSNSYFATTSSVDNLSSSVFQTNATQSNQITANSQSAATSLSASNASIVALSSSIYTTDTNQQNQINSLTAQTASYAISSSVKLVTDGLQTQINGLTSTSSFNDLSASIYSTDATQSSLIDGKLDSSSFNSYTQSTNTFTASISTSVGLLQTFSGSEYKADSASFDSRILSAGGQSQVQDEGTILGTATSFNFNGAGVTATINSGTASITIPGGGSIDTGSFATTGSNSFIGQQQITNGNVRFNTTGSSTNTNGIEWNNAVIYQDNFLNFVSKGNVGVAFSTDGTATNNAVNINFRNNNANGDVQFETVTGSITLSSKGAGKNILLTGSQVVINGVNFINFSSSVDSRLDGTATTGSNAFNGPQSIIGTPDASLDMYANAGNYDTFNVMASASNGIYISDFDQTNLSTWLQIPTNTGNNPAPQFKRSVGVTGSVDITGQFTINGVNITGSTINTSSFATTGSNTFVGKQTITGSIEMQLGSSIRLYQLSSSAGPRTSGIRFYTEQSASNNSRYLNIQAVPGLTNAVAISDFPSNNHFQFYYLDSHTIVNEATTVIQNTPGTQKLTLAPSEFNLNTTKTTGSADGYIFGSTSSFAQQTIGIYDDPNFTTDVENRIKVDANGIEFGDWDNGSAFDYIPYLTIAPNNGDNPAPQFKRDIAVTGSVSITEVMNLKPQNPLPSGNIGDLAVSGSSLYFYNGAWTLVI